LNFFHNYVVLKFMFCLLIKVYFSRKIHAFQLKVKKLRMDILVDTNSFLYYASQLIFFE